MATWSEVNVRSLGNAARVDAEYYQPDLLDLERRLQSSGLEIVPLASVVVDGARVVYQNTEILENPDGSDDFVRFLQAADVDRRLPVLRRHGVGWVARSDWDRYPKGRITPGEVLIEVKGRAEKVAIVPDDYPSQTLVTGTLFKLKVRRELISPYSLVAYLLSKYGRGFRSRCLTNTLIGYVSKPELYEIPVPLLPSDLNLRVDSLVRRALVASDRAEVSLGEAEELAATQLGWATADVPGSDLAYEGSFSKSRAAGRIDAEYFQPAKDAVLHRLRSSGGLRLRSYFDEVRSVVTPQSIHPDELVRNFDLTDALDPFLDDTKEVIPGHQIGSLKKRLKPGDLVVSRLRSYLREVALVVTSKDASPVGSSEFIVLRPIGGIPVEAALAMIRSWPVQLVLKWSQDGSNHPRFNASELLDLPVPPAFIANGADIAHLVSAAVDDRQEAYSLLAEAIRTLESGVG